MGSTSNLEIELDQSYMEEFSTKLHNRYGYPGSTAGPRYNDNWQNNIHLLNTQAAQTWFETEIVEKWKNWILQSLSAHQEENSDIISNISDNVERAQAYVETLPQVKQKTSNQGRPRKDWSNVSPKVFMFQTKQFRQFVSQVACARVLNGKVCGESLRIVNEVVLGCPAMRFQMQCRRQHRTSKIITY